jgi:cyclomaltodextrinase / maltogenic alpha-amylase / neopullulanase
MKIGIYKHYKGNSYEVIGVAKHSETLEELVVYRALHGEKKLWVRPKKMFLEDIEVDGRKIPRFELIK